MRKFTAVILTIAALAVIVCVPMALAVFSNVNPGSALGVTFWPGLCLLILAERLWSRPATETPAEGQVPHDYRSCELCGSTVSDTEGTTHELHQDTPFARVAFVCHACNHYRTKRALLVLVSFLVAVGILALLGFFRIR